MKETGVDLLAPAVGNYHGMVSGSAKSSLNMKRIAEIKKTVEITLVLHGGSGTPDGDFIKAINAGISIIHVNTEIRIAWRKGIEKTLRKDSDEVAPYKLMVGSIEEMKQVVSARLKLFSRL